MIVGMTIIDKRFSTPILAAIICIAFLLCPSSAKSAAGDMKLEVQLIWGTNDKKSPDETHKEVEAEVKKKLEDLPLKWSHYFQVKSKKFDLAVGETKKEALSDRCSVEVKNLNGSIEISLFGRGERLVKRTQTFPRKEILAVGGNAPNSTSWLVVLKRID